MNQELIYIGDKILQNNSYLAEQVRQLKEEEYGKKTVRTAEWEKLFSHIGEAIKGTATSRHQIEEWADREGDRKVKAKVDLTQSLRTINFVRRSIWQLFDEEVKEDRFSSQTVIHVSKTLDPLLDDVTNHFCQIYSTNIRLESEKKEMRLAELSAPVVPITEGVAVLPLIGEIDPPRGQKIMEISLRKSSELSLDHLLIDVSGVPVIDTEIAQYIYQIVNALQLVGVHATLTGLRPKIAKAVVDMGVSFAHVHTKASLQQALEEIGIYNHN